MNTFSIPNDYCLNAGESFLWCTWYGSRRVHGADEVDDGTNHLQVLKHPRGAGGGGF